MPINFNPFKDPRPFTPAEKNEGTPFVVGGEKIKSEFTFAELQSFMERIANDIADIATNQSVEDKLLMCIKSKTPPGRLEELQDAARKLSDSERKKVPFANELLRLPGNGSVRIAR